MTGSPTQEQKKRQGWKWLIRLVGIILLIMILWRINYPELWKCLRQTNIPLYLLSFLLIIPIYIFKTIRWRFLLRQLHINYSFRQAFLAFFAANFVAFITPGRLGEVVKAFYVKADKQVPLATTMPSVVFDRLFDVYFLLTVAFLGFIRFDLLDNLLSLGLIALVVILVPVILLSRKLVMPVVEWFFRWRWLQRIKDPVVGFCSHFYDGITAMLSFRLLVGIFYTVIAYLFLFLSAWVIVCSLGIYIDIMTVSIMIAMVNVLSFLPVTIGGFGFREAVLIFLFPLIGFSIEAAMAFSTLFFATFYLGGGFFGWICYFVKPVKWK